jgi:hypothetical protein
VRVPALLHHSSGCLLAITGGKRDAEFDVKKCWGRIPIRLQLSDVSAELTTTDPRRLTIGSNATGRLSSRDRELTEREIETAADVERRRRRARKNP